MTQSIVARTTSLVVGLLAALSIVGLVYFDAQDTSPGDLATVHADHAGLASAEHCDTCHGRGDQTMADACLACHQDIDQQFEAADGFHSGLAATLKRDCAACHSDHHGPDFKMTSDRSFQLAGLPSLRQFNHDGMDFRLAGKHDSVTCEVCHANATVDVLPKSGKRFLGLSQDCSNCHKDVHQGTFGKDCASCHGQQHPFPQAAAFVHTLAFELVGAHGQAACVRCHPPESEKAIEFLISVALTNPVDPSAVRSCQDCHASPHEERFLDTVSRQMGVTAGNSCQRCHPAVHDSFAGLATLAPPTHACTGFQLDPPHDNLSCNACHEGYGTEKPDIQSFHESYPGRHPDDCRVCHNDPHDGQFQRGVFKTLECIACHFRERFSPSRFTAQHHDQTHFPLVGKHEKVACKQCHVLSENVPQQVGDGGKVTPAADRSQPNPTRNQQPVRIFNGTATSCRGCHKDPHRSQFELGPLRGSDCKSCHDEHTFRQHTFSAEQHAKTNFALTGAHTAVACNRCHAPANDGDPTAPLVFHAAPTQCSACHHDVHLGRFDLPNLPLVVNGKTDCARCHGTESFRKVSAVDFDHALWTGYALDAAHARARCVDCHGKQDLTTVAGKRRQINGEQCQSCHSDPHVGQFGPTESIDCKRCHQVGDRFTELVFDHQLHSKFSLDRDHQRIQCSGCHKPQPLLQGGTAIRYKPLGTTCGDCHVPTGARETLRRGRQ